MSRVLIVGPPEGRESLEDVLRRGFDLEAVDGVADALASLSPPPEALVIAVDGPDDSEAALSLIRAVRSRPDTAAIAVLGVASQPRPHLAERVLEAGADDYFVTAGPGAASELEARVLAQLRARRRPSP